MFLNICYPEVDLLQSNLVPTVNNTNTLDMVKVFYSFTLWEIFRWTQLYWKMPKSASKGKLIFFNHCIAESDAVYYSKRKNTFTKQRRRFVLSSVQILNRQRQWKRILYWWSTHISQMYSLLFYALVNSDTHSLQVNTSCVSSCCCIV